MVEVLPAIIVSQGKTMSYGELPAINPVSGGKRGSRTAEVAAGWPKHSGRWLDGEGG